jgi:hypothetical protein
MRDVNMLIFTAVLQGAKFSKVFPSLQDLQRRIVRLQHFLNLFLARRLMKRTVQSVGSSCARRIRDPSLNGRLDRCPDDVVVVGSLGSPSQAEPHRWAGVRVRCCAAVVHGT